MNGVGQKTPQGSFNKSTKKDASARENNRIAREDQGAKSYELKTGAAMAMLRLTGKALFDEPYEKDTMG